MTGSVCRLANKRIKMDETMEVQNENKVRRQILELFLVLCADLQMCFIVDIFMHFCCLCFNR